MNCRKVRQYLYGYCKNELTPAESEKIKAHLDDCAECARAMEKVTVASNLLEKSLEAFVPSPDFNEKLLAKIRSLPLEVKEGKKQTWWQKLLHETFPSIRLRWAAAGAVSVIVLALVITMVTQKRFSLGPESIVSDSTFAQNQNLAGS
ncbi:MAG TPA: zf-HC2 domain-containing protein, partial [candidate division Zixibacteria bacterium]